MTPAARRTPLVCTGAEDALDEKWLMAAVELLELGKDIKIMSLEVICFTVTVHGKVMSYAKRMSRSWISSVTILLWLNVA